MSRDHQGADKRNCVEDDREVARDAVDDDPSMANERRELHDGEDAWNWVSVDVRQVKRKRHTSRQHTGQMHYDANFVPVGIEVVEALSGGGAIGTRHWISWAEGAAEV